MASISSRLSPRHDHQQGLRWRDNTSDRVDCELLHQAVHGSGQQLKLGLLLGLDQVWASPFAFCSALASSSNRVRRYSAIAWPRVLADRGRGRLGLTQVTLLNPELLFAARSSSWRTSK